MSEVFLLSKILCTRAEKAMQVVVGADVFAQPEP